MEAIKPTIIEEARALLISLTDIEIEVLKNYIGKFSEAEENKKRRTKKVPKLHSILTLLLSEASAEEVIAVLQNELGANTYAKQFVLLHRLSHILGKTLITDKALHQKGMYEQVFISRVEIAEKKMYAEVLRKRGMTVQLLKVYKSAIGLARKYEQYDDLVQLLSWKQEIAALQKDRKEYQDLGNQIESAKAHRDAFELAKSYYYKSALLTDHDSLDRNKNEKELMNFLRSAFRDLDNRLKTIDSSAVKYYHLQIKADILQRGGSYHKAEEPLREMLSLALKSPYLKRKTTIGVVYLMLAENQLHKEDYEDARTFARRAQNFFEPKSGNTSYAIEMEYFALLYDGKVKQARILLYEALQSGVEVSAYITAKRKFLLANSYFLMGLHLQTFQLLNEAASLRKNQGGWNPSYRILEIMNCIERELFDNADALIISFYQYSRTLEEDQMRQRDYIILDVLTKLRNSGYNFEETAEKSKQELRKLKGNDPEIKYKIQSAEIIVFDKWFESKVPKKQATEEDFAYVLHYA